MPAPSTQESSTFWLTPIVGGIAGVTADVLTHPAATVKTRIQVQGVGGASRAKDVLRYSNPLTAASSMIAKEGPMSLLKGVGAVATGSPLGSGLYFVGIEGTKAALGGNGFLTNFAAGCTGQLLGSCGWVPMDVIKERCQIQGQVKSSRNYGSSYAMFSGIMRTEGLIGLYRAFWVHQMTWVPFNGIYWGVYGSVKSYQESTEGKKFFGEGAFAFLARASAAGITSSYLTNPLDLVKTRVQVAMANPELFPFKNSFECAKLVLREEGPMAFFAGVTPRIVWLTPHRAIMLATYELLWSWVSSAAKEEA